MSKLVIVESPTKARTIGRMLGGNYNIIASMGHVRDLPEHEFGIDVENGFAPLYVDTARGRSVIRSLRDAAKKADEIYLATDPDREGEAIAWHLREVLAPANRKARFHRVTFHEITRQAIENAMAAKGDINLLLVDAQQARRILDRIVGYQVSPLLWRKLGKGSSAGRVQSAALRLIVEREREISSFKPEEFWNLSAKFDAAGRGIFTGRLFKIDGKDAVIPSAGDALNAEQAIRAGSAPKAAMVTVQERKRNPYPPFTTSTLQQAANQQLHYSATSTMRYAQQLYEGVELGGGASAGLITYMRTDSVTIAREAQIAAAEFIRETYGPEYLPPKFNYYKNKAAAQEAHEAIRPTDVRRTPESLAPFLDAPQLKLYTLIWKRFTASQMAQAKQELITANVVIDGSDRKEYTFRSSATLTVFPGFLKLSGETSAQNDEESRPALLRSLKNGETVAMKELLKEQKFTEPPPRFTEASLIKLLEENGIGRPSTYATIIRTIQDRDYVRKEQNKLLPTEVGFTVNDFLVEKLPELFDIGFTAQMEQKLDDIEDGRIPWREMMTDFYSRFTPWLAAARESGAPSAADASALLAVFDGVRFDAKQKVGTRTFDDGRFVASIREKFSSSGKISDKQYGALIAMAAKYADQAADRIASLPAAAQNEVAEAKKQIEERLRRNTVSRQSAENGEAMDYAKLFAAFDRVSFPEVKPGGKFSFDEGKFFHSLKKQALEKHMLSPKQQAVLAKMAKKYRAQLTDPDEVFRMLKIDDAPAPSEGTDAPAPAAGMPDVAALLAELAKVREWEAPVRKGRFAFDDRKFYLSLAKQAEEKKILSSKQISALEKLVSKYTKNK